MHYRKAVGSVRLNAPVAMKVFKGQIMSTANLFYAPLFVTLILVNTGCFAETVKSCDQLRKEVSEKIKSNGVANFEVTIASSASDKTGTIVGSCNNGKNFIVYKKNARPDVSQQAFNLPKSPTLKTAPAGSSVSVQLKTEADNFAQLNNWSKLAQQIANKAVIERNVEMYRAAIEFRDQLIPYNFQFFSAYNVANELTKSGFTPMEAPAKSGDSASIVACKSGSDCRVIDARVAIFMAPVVLLARGANHTASARPPAVPHPLIVLSPFPGIVLNVPSMTPSISQPGRFSPLPGVPPVNVPIPIPHPVPLGPILGGVAGQASPPTIPPITLPGSVAGHRVCVPWC